MLERPAKLSNKASNSLLLGIATAGPRLVAVGERGIILLSDNDGIEWQQAASPVSVTLTAIHFVDRSHGWVVGHDGVILHTTDGGLNWTKQLDGRLINAQVLKAAEQQLVEARRIDNPARIAQAIEVLDDASAANRFGPSRPLFDVKFKDRRRGVVVGAFGLVLYTNDSGVTWRLPVEPPNPTRLHINALTITQDDVLLASAEEGKIFRSRDDGQRWETLDTRYDGQLYGVLAVADILIAFGFVGNVFRSTTNGITWKQVVVDTQRSVVAGAQLKNGALILVDQAGQIFKSEDRGKTFRLVGTTVGMQTTSLSVTANQTLIVFVGRSGTRRVNIAP